MCVRLLKLTAWASRECFLCAGSPALCLPLVGTSFHLLRPSSAQHVRVPIPPFSTLFFFDQYYQKVETLNGCCHLALEDAVCSFLSGLCI